MVKTLNLERLRPLEAVAVLPVLGLTGLQEMTAALVVDHGQKATHRMVVPLNSLDHRVVDSVILVATAIQVPIVMLVPVVAVVLVT